MDMSLPDEDLSRASVSFSTTLAPEDLFKVVAVSALRSRIVQALLFIGPFLWIAGRAGIDPSLRQLGLQLLWLDVSVPVFILLAGSYAAYRPGAKEIYEPTRWTFTDAVIHLERGEVDAVADWGDFIRWRIEGGCYLLHMTSREYVALPVRDVPSLDRDDLESLFRHHLGRPSR